MTRTPPARSPAASFLAFAAVGLAVFFSACSSSNETPVWLARGPATEPAPPRPLTIAAGEDPGERRVITLDATVPRTSIGHFHAGDRVELRVLEGLWTYAPGAERVGPNGLRELCRAPAPHVCAAGEAALPGMALLLFSKVDPKPPACAPSHRLSIPTGVEFAMPQDAFLFLAPNDWEDGVFNNVGAMDVIVETAANKTAPAITKQKLSVKANEARTPLGRLSAGVYFRVSVLSGTWAHEPGAARVGSEGSATEKCFGAGGHTCAAGEGRAPLMGLTLLMASCEDGGVPLAVPDRIQAVGTGVSTVVQNDGELLLGPNDWEDGCHDNSGFMRVEMIVERAARH